VRYRLAIDPDFGRFAGWTVESAERCLIEEIGADSAIELLGTLGSSEARAASRRLSVKPDSATSWDNAEAAQGGALRPAARKFLLRQPGHHGAAVRHTECRFMDVGDIRQRLGRSKTCWRSMR
jgi:hypothetical protein